MSEQELFENFLNCLEFNVSEYLDSELSEFQEEMIENATFIFKENIIGEISKLGCNFKKNKEKFDTFISEAEKKLEDDKYKDSIKDLKQMFGVYVKKLQELIEKTCVAIIPIKEFPWIDLIFRSVPRIIVNKKKVSLSDVGIAYYGEIKCVISRTTIYGKIKDAEPLFAPFMGELDLSDFKIDDDQKIIKSKDFSYVDAIINALDYDTTQDQLVKYHEGYQRHGEPICDFLMKDIDLLESMKKVYSGLDSGRSNTNTAVCGIAIPFVNNNTSLVLINDDGDKNIRRYSLCFEAVLRFSAACCEAPSTRSAESGQAQATGGPEMKEWTAEELAQSAQQRTPDLDVWTEEDLQKMSETRGDALPDGIEMWTEEELQDLASKRQGGGLDIPEWLPDKNLSECSKCGYGLRKGWSECPICETPVNSSASPTPSTPSETEEADVQKEENLTEDTSEPSDDSDTEKSDSNLL